MKIINKLKRIYGEIKNNISAKKIIDNVSREILINFYTADIDFIKKMFDTFLNIQNDNFNFKCLKHVKRHIKYMIWEIKAIEKINQKEKKALREQNKIEEKIII